MRKVSSNGTLSMNERGRNFSNRFLRCQGASAINDRGRYALSVLPDILRTFFIGGFYYVQFRLEGII